MKIYTRTGDQGSTSLFGNQRVPKNDLRINAYGTIDELNALLGLVLAEDVPKNVNEVVLKLQNQMFDLGAELATPDSQRKSTEIIQPSDVEQQEVLIDMFEQQLAPLTSFILPGGTKAAATLHLARSVCRRAEREIVALAQTASIRDVVLEFVNRTSDLLFVLARTANREAVSGDIPWTKGH